MTIPATGGNAGVFAPFEWLLALRYLRARRRKGSVSIIAVFSVAGIMLGVAALIIVLSVMNGFRQEMFDKFLGLHSHVTVKPLGRTFADYSETAERLKAVPGVKIHPCRDRRPGDDFLGSWLLGRRCAGHAGSRP